MLRFLGEALSALFFFLVARAAVAAVWRGFRSTMSVPNPAYKPPKTTERDIRTSGELHKDPSCGTFVLTDSAFTLADDGITYYFCSKDCRDKFQTDRREKKWGKSTTVRS
jgi:YHS domain-containing protein